MAVTSQQVIDTYRYYLNRTPGTAEVNFWVDYSKANGAAQTNAAFLASARPELQDITRSAYQSTLGRTPSQSEVDFWTNYALNSGVQEASAAFMVGAEREIAGRSPPAQTTTTTTTSSTPTTTTAQPTTTTTSGSSVVATLAQQLKDQYQAINKSSGYTYQFPDRLDELFRVQAEALAKSGVTNIYDVGVKTTIKNVPNTPVIQRAIYDANDNFTGRFQYLKVAGYEGYGESENPILQPLNNFELNNLKENSDGALTTTIQAPIKIVYNTKTGQPLQTGFREQDELTNFQGLDIWGGANLGKGLDLFSIQFSAEGAPIFVPVWQETSDKRKIGQIVALVGSFFAPQLGAYLAPGASAATQAAIGGAAFGGGTAALTGQNVLTGALKGAIGSITTTNYAEAVGRSLGITSQAAAITVGNSLINAGLSGIQAAVTPGANVEKSMLGGAVTGAVMVNATQLAETVLGASTVKQLQDLTNLTAQDIGNIFGNSVVQGVIAGINNQDAGQAFINTAISNGASQSLANSMLTKFSKAFEGKEDVLAGIVTTVRGVADTGINASLYNRDVKQALENAVPGIIISSFKAYNLTADEMQKRRTAEEQRKTTALKFDDLETLLAGPVSAEVLAQTKAQKLFGEDVVGEISEYIPELGMNRVRKTIQGTRNDGTLYEYQINIYEDGIVDYQYSTKEGELGVRIVASDKRPDLKNSVPGTGDVPIERADQKPPLTGLIDLRTFVANVLPTGNVIFSKTADAVGRGGKGSSTFQFIGRDNLGRDRFDIGGTNFTVIALDGKDAFVSDNFKVVMVPVPNPSTGEPELKPTPQSEPFNPPQQTPAPEVAQQPTPEVQPKPETPTTPVVGDEGKTGAEGATGVAGGAPSGPSQAAPSLSPQPGAVVRPETTIPSTPGATTGVSTKPANAVTVVDAQNYLNETNDQAGTVIILEAAAGTRPIDEALAVLQKANITPILSVVDRDAEIAILKEIEQQLEADRQARERGRAERVERATGVRTEREQAQYEREQAKFESDLKGLEAAIAKAKSDEEKAQARQVFTTQQRERLLEAGRLTGGLQAQIDAELGNLLDQYEDAQRRAGRAVTQKEGLVAPQQPGDVGRGISDQDVIDFLGLGRDEAERYGFFGDTEGVAGGLGPGSGVEGEGPGSGVEGTGPGSGTIGVGPGAGEEGFGPGGGETDEVTTKLRPVVIYDQTPSPRATAGIPERVTAQAVEGILGDKEPLFGGDEDEQRQVWNRRSLRLRKALGL